MKSESKVLEILDEKKRLSSHYYDNFEKHLKRGRLSKSSEFLWGAFCSLLYAVALIYGETLNNPSKMIDFAKRISNIVNDESIYLGMMEGKELHANFYHNFLDEEGINLKRKSIDLAMRKLLDILNEKVEESKIKSN